MAADFAGVRRKLARAKDKLNALSAEVAAYLNPPPYRLVVETDGNHQAIVCHIDREANDAWADEMAEVVYQARSALDLTIPQLILDSRQPSRKGTHFPICSNRDGYLKKGKDGKSTRDKLLRGIAPRHRKIIDDVQPYQRGRGVHRDPLAILSTISNRDKHNDIYVCVAAIGNPTFKLIRPGLAPPDQEVTIRFGEPFRPHPMTDGAEFIGLDWTPPAGAPPSAVNTEVYLETVDMQATLGFTSGDRSFTLDDIDRGVLAVSKIIDRFAARLKP
jgi:hypothetical protein